MLQENPSLTRTDILDDLITSTTPLDGSAKGVWNAQGGYGLINAETAVTLASTLSVVSTSPGEAQSINFAPSAITVTFNKPVNLATVSSTDIAVTAPNGAKVTIGKPVGVDNATDPTVVSFPITIVPAANKVATGLYHILVGAGAIQSQSGQVLKSNFTTTFTIASTVAPVVTSTAIVGRYVSVHFSEAMNPATISQSSVYIVRANGGSTLLNANSIRVSNLPGVTFYYNPVTFIATFDLTALPQTSLPTDHYGIVVNDTATDGIGDPLNGSFSGVFPSGTSPATAANFVQDLGTVKLAAPIITQLTLAPTSDSGITGDNNTNIATPSLIGQVTAIFPATLGGLVVYAEFNGIAPLRSRHRRPRPGDRDRRAGLHRPL